MGIFNDDFPGHEGYVVGFHERAPGSAVYRELDGSDLDERDVHVIAVGCDCGWRSPHLVAPHGTLWHPCSVFLPTVSHEDFVRAILHWHWEQMRGFNVGGTGRSLRELADFCAPKLERMRRQP